MIADGLKSLAVDIDTLKLMEDNPRRGDVTAVKRSYARFGQVKPIVATPDMTVIAGNHSLIAARELGWTEIAVNVVPFDSEEAKAYALADNRTADLGTYDNEALAGLLTEVAVDPELLLATGYTEADVEALTHLAMPPDLDDLIDDIGDPTAEDGLIRVTLKLSPELAEALQAEIKRVGSDQQAVELWLNL